MLLSDVSQITTLSPSGNKEDFMCVYERGMFIAKIAENILLLFAIKQQCTVSLSYHPASCLHKIAL